jgi:dihydroorotase
LKTIFLNFRVVDADIDVFGSLVVEDGKVLEVIPRENDRRLMVHAPDSAVVINGAFLGGKNAAPAVLMPAFIDMHAHFREPGFSDKETLESACLAAAAGGFGTVVCMANTNPPTDSLPRALAIRERASALGLIDLYPAISLTKGMLGRELSPFLEEGRADKNVLLLSEDGKDVHDDGLFYAALKRAAAMGIPVSCHCDRGGEVEAVRRAIKAGADTGARVHIAHVSKKQTVDLVREAKRGGQSITAEATPHHISLTRETAEMLGAETRGKVAPPLGTAEDMEAVCGGLDGEYIDVIATDHAPHTEQDKLAGSPGFTGLETAFSRVYDTLVKNYRYDAGHFDLSAISRMMSERPAQILRLKDRGTFAAGQLADIVMIDLNIKHELIPENLKSRGKNTPFTDGIYSIKLLRHTAGSMLS